MKKAINVILGLCAVVLLYLCYESIMQPIQFNKEKDIREAAVKARLIQIKDAEEQYRQQHQGEFCDTLDVLINFIKTARIPHVTKVGELSDKQMESGLTESKAAAIVNSGTPLPSQPTVCRISVATRHGLPWPKPLWVQTVTQIHSNSSRIVTGRLLNWRKPFT